MQMVMFRRYNTVNAMKRTIGCGSGCSNPNNKIGERFTFLGIANCYQTVVQY